MKKLIVLGVAFGFIGILSANAQTEEAKEVKKSEPIEVTKETAKKGVVTEENTSSDLTASAKKLGSCCKNSMKKGKKPCCSKNFNDLGSCCLKSLADGKDACCIQAPSKKSSSSDKTKGKAE